MFSSSAFAPEDSAFVDPVEAENIFVHLLRWISMFFTNPQENVRGYEPAPGDIAECTVGRLQHPGWALRCKIVRLFGPC